MKQFRRGRSSGMDTPEVVSLLDSDEDAAEDQSQQPQKRQQQQHARGTDDMKAAGSNAVEGRVGIRNRRAASAALRKITQPPVGSEYAGDYAFVSDDDDDGGHPQPLQHQQQLKAKQLAAGRQSTLHQQQQQPPLAKGADEHGKAATQQQHPMFAKAGNSKRAGPAAAVMQPPAKRSKAGTSSSAPARKAAADKAVRGTRQTTLQSKGFGSLCFSMSQPAAAGAAGGLQLTTSSSQDDGPASQPHATWSASPQPMPAAAAVDDSQWVDKHQPRTLDDLIVHKRKVCEVQGWLQGYLDSRAAAPSRALLITGPSGCGKSVTLRLLAAALGFEVMEWHAPVPTLWTDYQYQAGAGVGYSSKLDEFDMFVTRCKFAALPLASASSGKATQQQQQLLRQQTLSSQQQEHSQQQQPKRGRLKLLLIEDLPYVGEASRRARLAAALQDLATTARCPVVVVATTEEGTSSGSSRTGGGYGGAAGAAASSKGLHKDLVAVLDRMGAAHISFNAITANNITKALHVIADREGLALQPDVADGIAQAAAGDLRNAIQSLQLMHMQDRGAAAAAGAGRGTKAAGKGKAKAPKRPRRAMPKDAEAIAAAEAAKQLVACRVSRDQHLSVFHAVGKLLHYKRNQPVTEAMTTVTGSQHQQQDQADMSTVVAQQGDNSQMDLSDADMALQSQGNSSHNRLWRPPLGLDPEGIIQGSGLEALQVTAFLAENYLHFLADEAMGETAAAAAYLSDAGYMACHRNAAASSSSFWDESDTVTSSIQAAASSSVAARGLLFSNTKPAPSRWLPVRGSSCFQPEKAAAGNLQKLGETVQQLQDSWAAAGPAQQQAVLQLAGQLLHAGRQERASQVLPYLQVLCKHRSRMWLHQLLPRSWWYLWGGQVTEQQSAAVQGAQTAAALQAAVAVAAANIAGTGSETGAITDKNSVDGADDHSDPIEDDFD